MKVEVIKPEPVPTMVKIEIPIELAQLIVVSLGRNHTGHMKNKVLSGLHYEFFNKLDNAVGRGNFDCVIKSKYGAGDYGAYIEELK